MKPTIPQVEEALGVKAEDWDCVDPEKLIDAIYELSVTITNSPPNQNNLHHLRRVQLPGKESR